MNEFTHDPAIASALRSLVNLQVIRTAMLAGFLTREQAVELAAGQAHDFKLRHLLAQKLKARELVREDEARTGAKP